MPTMTPQQVLNLLKQQQYAPLYFLQGEEGYYIDLITAYVAQQVLSESEKAFNLTILYGRDQAMGDVIRQAQQYSIMGGRQVVVVKEAQDVTDIHRETGQTTLINYLTTPNPTTLLVFAYKHKSIPANTKLGKILVEQAILVNSHPLYDNQIPAWVRSYTIEQKVVITDQAIQLLQTLVGSDLGRLAKEIDKIILNLQPEETIMDSHVQMYVGMSKQFNAFELQDAIASRNIFKANQLVLQLAGNTRSQVAIPVVSLLFTFFSKILLLHHTSDKSNHALTQTLQINNYFIPQYLAAARLYSIPQVIQNISHLQEADRQLKGVAYPFVGEGEILKELVYKLLH